MLRVLCCTRVLVEDEVMSMLASLVACETPAVESSHTQLLVYRQEWDELHHDLLTTVTNLPADLWSFDR